MVLSNVTIDGKSFDGGNKYFSSTRWRIYIQIELGKNDIMNSIRSLSKILQHPITNRMLYE